MVNENFEELIKKKDVISVNISTLSLDDDRIFNAAQVLSTSDGKLGYLVDSNGNIQLHKLGAVHVEGLTLRQVSEKIKNELGIYVKDAVVVTAFVNKKILVFGEVKSPQLINIGGEKEKINVLEALTIAGGVNEAGDNKNILIIREDKGKKVFKHLNFEDMAVLNSPWYNLKPDDIVYVQPDVERGTAADKIAKRQMIVSSLLTGVSLLLIIYDRLIK
ncbi:polysaccharide biosynthesis/export family protein [Ferruginibacter lapsinanis]|uniref:polysaccharide biosynthesis/export family protein n=1 Tax=Ferruginibacter lapsinanis TaxID=563172 RepID=UPI001E36C8D7|nr:polysaccharide biosynthesis/export family protein [Ferruginibacter lapsinanis]UEG49482.1 polysaccharide biosynthesis/export family protein [Ferruginibacter lapsinanis]